MMFKDQIQPDEHVAYGVDDATRILKKLAHPEGELRPYEDSVRDCGRVLVPNTKYPHLGKGVVFENKDRVMEEYYPFVPLLVSGIPKRLQP